MGCLRGLGHLRLDEAHPEPLISLQHTQGMCPPSEGREQCTRELLPGEVRAGKLVGGQGEGGGWEKRTEPRGPSNPEAAVD